MKTKRVVIGTMAAAMLAMSVCASPVTYAAGETVQISVGSATVEAGGTFSVDVSMSAIPSKGIQACDFAVEFDSSLITVTDVTAGALTKTGADEADSSAAMMPLFDSEIYSEEGTVELLWSTSLEDSTYWLNGEGVFCTISGTVADSVAAGTEIDLTIAPIERETYPGSGVMNSTINAGYVDGTSSVKYTASTTNGVLTVAGSETTTGGTEAGLRGDANCDGSVLVNDAVLVMAYCANAEENPITELGQANADVYQTGDGIAVTDAAQIQKYLAKLVPSL